jgi:hypothetical protein
MEDLATDCGTIFEATSFLAYFNELPDQRQAVKVVYPLDEVLLLALLAVLAGAEAFTDIARLARRRLHFCAGSAHSAMAHRRMIASATFLPPSTPNTSSVVSSPGLPR